MGTPNGDLMSGRVLIAEDDADWVSLLRSLLEAHGFESLSVSRGVDAIECAKTLWPECVVLDLEMPGGSGASVLAALRSNKNTRNLPIFVLSSHNDPDLINELNSAGISGYFMKDQGVIKLVSSIAETLGKVER